MTLIPNIFQHTRAPIPNLQETDCYLGFVVAFMNNQSVGEVRLQSANPGDNPVIDQKFLSHPFDRRVAIESVRNVLEFLDDSRFAEDRIRMAAAPSGRTDEEIYVSHHATASALFSPTFCVAATWLVIFANASAYVTIRITYKSRQ